MDVTDGGDFSGSVEDVGSADSPASQNEIDNQPGDDVAEQNTRQSPPSASSEFVDVPGFGRVHKDDAPKAKEFVRGAMQAFEHASLSTKQLKQMKADPESFFQEQGLDLDSIAARHLSRKLEEQLQTPEQRQMSEQERAFKAREDAIAKREQEFEAQRLEELTRHEVQQIDSSFQDALKSSGLPPTRQNLREMARISRDYLAKGIDPPAAHVAQLVRDELTKNQDWRTQQVFDESTDDEFGAWFAGLGEKRIERVRQHLLKQVTSPTTRRQPAPGPRAQPKSTNGARVMTESEWRKWRDK